MMGRHEGWYGFCKEYYQNFVWNHSLMRKMTMTLGWEPKKHIKSKEYCHSPKKTTKKTLQKHQNIWKNHPTSLKMSIICPITCIIDQNNLLIYKKKKGQKWRETAENAKKQSKKGQKWTRFCSDCTPLVDATLRPTSKTRGPTRCARWRPPGFLGGLR